MIFHMPGPMIRAPEVSPGHQYTVTASSTGMRTNIIRWILQPISEGEGFVRKITRMKIVYMYVPYYNGKAK